MLNPALDISRHWYYEDFIREQDDRLPTMSLKKFSNSLFHVCPLLSHWGDDHEQTFQNFMAYKTRVPVCGAIMLNETWDKVSYRNDLRSLSVSVLTSALFVVSACQRMEVDLSMELSQRQD